MGNFGRLGLCFLQEFLHAHYSHIPEARMWHWQILPANVNFETVGSRFQQARLLPSLRFLVQYAVPSVSRVRTGNAQLAMARAQKSAGALWIGSEHVFFFREASTEGNNALANCHLPTTHTELPHWVCPLIADLVGVHERQIHRNVDAVLEQFAREECSPAVRLLRTVNWAALPLAWEPLFLSHVPPPTTAQNEDAQLRLVRAITPEWMDAEIQNEVVSLLQDITTVGNQ
jgi:hypothetical protein